MKKPAFTLIELTITIAILGLTLTITGGVLLSVVKSFQKQNELQRIERNGDIALRTIEEKVRKAKTVEAITLNTFPAIRIHSDDGVPSVIGISQTTIPGCVGPNGVLFVTSRAIPASNSLVATNEEKITDDTNQGVNIDTSPTGLVLDVVDGKPVQVSATILVNSSTCKASADRISKVFSTFVTARGSY